MSGLTGVLCRRKVNMLRDGYDWSVVVSTKSTQPMPQEHIDEFIKAVHGGRGELDAWLECNNEAECRAAIFGIIEEEREAIIAKLLELGALGDGTYIEAIRMRSNIPVQAGTYG